MSETTAGVGAPTKERSDARLEFDAGMAPHVRHIRLPDNPDVAWCGARRPTGWRRFYYHEVPEAAICVVCASFPGALEYAKGGTA